jgi:hypothetical protein
MMGRRAFVSSVAGGFVVWPLAAHAQRQGLPVIGYLANASAAAFTNYVDAFRRGLVETGYVEGQNVAIEYRWTEGRRDRARNEGDLDHVSRPSSRHMPVRCLSATIRFSPVLALTNGVGGEICATDQLFIP